MPAIPKTEKEKKELLENFESFLKNLSSHKKFQEIFGAVPMGDADIETNLEFVKSLIVAQEEEIRERIQKEEEALEAQRLELDQEKQRLLEALKEKIRRAIALIDADDLPAAMEIINESDDIREGVALHYNDAGMQARAGKAYDEAIKYYSRAISVSSEDENLYYNMGRAYYEAGDLDHAENCLANAMKLNPDFQAGEVFYQHLIKRRAAGNQPTQQAAVEKKSQGFLKKILKR
jgi:tetratricopeptide (TPR) repeat protein